MCDFISFRYYLADPQCQRWSQQNRENMKRKEGWKLSTESPKRHLVLPDGFKKLSKSDELTETSNGVTFTRGHGMTPTSHK